MLPSRVEKQLQVMLQHPEAIVGCKFERVPADATPRYVSWANSLSGAQLRLQAFRELTIIQPTWMFARTLWVRIGGKNLFLLLIGA